jgi:hypothetical protein
MATACFLEVTLGPLEDPLLRVPALYSDMTLDTFWALPAVVLGFFMGDTFSYLKGPKRVPWYLLRGDLGGLRFQTRPLS